MEGVFLMFLSTYGSFALAWIASKIWEHHLMTKRDDDKQ
jgi:hypothetical protein